MRESTLLGNFSRLAELKVIFLKKICFQISSRGVSVCTKFQVFIVFRLAREHDIKPHTDLTKI